MTVERIDSCTTLGWKVPGGSTFLAQNWDWKTKQKPNLIILHVNPRNVPGMNLPSFQMITEAGIIDKVGFSEHGVGCLLNEIRAKGVDLKRMPMHFALRNILESRTKKEALNKIEAIGLVGSSRILLATSQVPTGLEYTSTVFQDPSVDNLGRVFHANNLILNHESVFEPLWLQDSLVFRSS